MDPSLIRTYLPENARDGESTWLNVLVDFALESSVDCTFHELRRLHRNEGTLGTASQACDLSSRSRQALYPLVAGVESLGFELDEIARRLPLAAGFRDATDFYRSMAAPGCAIPENQVQVPWTMSCYESWNATERSFRTEEDVRAFRETRQWASQLRQYQNTVLRALDSGRPLAVSFCSAVLSDFSTDAGHGQGVNGCDGGAYAEHGSHASTLIGYREVPSVSDSGARGVEVLLKNSWGLDWCAHHGERCEDGNLWIPLEALARNSRALSELTGTGRVLQQTE